jgi:hypothetical protein
VTILSSTLGRMIAIEKEFKIFSKCSIKTVERLAVGF